jgi:hypothetical protein
VRRAGLLICLALVAGVAAVATAAPPGATTNAATAVTATTAELNGTVVTDGATTYHFEWGTTTAYGSSSPETSVTGGGPSGKSVSDRIAGLQPSTTYHFRIVAKNADGVTNGADMTFTTPAAGANDNVLTIAKDPRTVTFGNPVTISGRLTGPGAAGETVELESTEFPYTTPFRSAGTATTDANGNYSFTVTPQRNTRYRAIARTNPRTQSADIAVGVRRRVSLRIGDRTPERGDRVRFAGTVTPAADGKVALLQRRTRRGWRTISTPTLVSTTAAGTTTRSKYARRIRIRRGGLYRTVVRKQGNEYVTGKTRRKRITVR